jgi:hypothetical protein
MVDIACDRRERDAQRPAEQRHDRLRCPERGADPERRRQRHPHHRTLPERRRKRVGGERERQEEHVDHGAPHSRCGQVRNNVAERPVRCRV